MGTAAGDRLYSRSAVSMAAFSTARSVRSSYTLGSLMKSPGPREVGLLSPMAGPCQTPCSRALPHPQPAAAPALRLTGSPAHQLTEDRRTLAGTEIMKREVKEGAELVADDAHEGLHVGCIHQPVREDSVGREGAEPWERRGQGPAARAGHQAREARVWHLSGASVQPRTGHGHLT